MEVRLTPAAAGDLDPTFGLSGVAVLPPSLVANASDPTKSNGFRATAATVQPDGRIIVVGSVSPMMSPNSDMAVVRLTPDGHPDTTFGTDGWVQIPSATSASAGAVAVQSDGRIVVAGSMSVTLPANPTTSEFAVTRLTADGKLDTTFGNGGTATALFWEESTASAVAILPDGRIVVGGSTQTIPPLSYPFNPDYWTGGFAVAQFTPDGQPDPTFGNGGRVTVEFPVGQSDSAAASSMAVQPDGRILLAGSTRVAELPTHAANPVHDSLSYSTDDFAVIRLTSAGQLDPTFGDGGRVRIPFDLGGSNDDQADAIAVRPDGRIVVAGTANTATGNAAAWDDVVARLNPDGQLDASFDGDGRAGVPGDGQASAIAPGGQIVFAGADLVRLTADGQLDPTFGTGGRAPNPYSLGSLKYNTHANLTVQPDGQIVVASRFGPVLRVLGQAISAPVSAVPGSVLAGGTPDGTARLIAPTGGNSTLTPYRLGDSVSFFANGVIVRTATADVTGDGVPDLIGAAGPGGGPNVMILDGKTRAKVADFFAFENTFTGGLYVTAADLNGDGKADLVVTPDQGGGPVVAIYDGAKLAAGQTADAAQMTRFLGIDDTSFRGGARAALGDVSGDGTPDLLISAGFLGGPRIALFDGKTVAGSGSPVKLMPDFFAFEPSLRNGAFVTAGDLNADGKADLVFGGGPGGGPRVRAFDGAKLLAAGSFNNLDDVAGSAQVGNFFAGDSSLRGGVRLAMRDIHGTGKSDLIVATGEGEPSQVRIYPGTNPLATATPTGGQALDPFNGATLANGVFVG